MQVPVLPNEPDQSASAGWGGALRARGEGRARAAPELS